MHEKKDFGPLRVKRGDREEIIVPDPEQTVRTVCSVCNNGWMHNLEDANIPLIGKMFDDDKHVQLCPGRDASPERQA
jgi:hypothetical protein